MRAVLAAAGASLTIGGTATTALTVAEGTFTAYSTIQSLRQRDLMNNEISQEEADYNLGMAIPGIFAGPATKFGGKLFKPNFAASVSVADEAVTAGRATTWNQFQQMTSGQLAALEKNTKLTKIQIEAKKDKLEKQLESVKGELTALNAVLKELAPIILEVSKISFYNTETTESSRTTNQNETKVKYKRNIIQISNGN